MEQSSRLRQQYQQMREDINVNKLSHLVVQDHQLRNRKLLVGPRWTYDSSFEKPTVVKDMGEYKMQVYSVDQQERLGVSEFGEDLSATTTETVPIFTSSNTDTVAMDVPLFIRLMEFAREDENSDVGIQNVAENGALLSANGQPMTMAHYNELVTQQASLTPIMSSPMSSMGSEDVLVLEVPLLIRLLEFAREEATSDNDLHFVAENVIKLNAENEPMSLQNYDTLVVSSTADMMITDIAKSFFLEMNQECRDFIREKCSTCAGSGRACWRECIVQYKEELNELGCRRPDRAPPSPSTME